MPIEFATDERLDRIFAASRNCSETEISTRIVEIIRMIERQDEASLLNAVPHLERLLNRLAYVGRGTRGALYAATRTHVLAGWRYLMRGEFPHAVRELQTAGGCCVDMV